MHPRLGPDVNKATDWCKVGVEDWGRHLDTYEGLEYALIQNARRVAEEAAHNYRSFHVGCAILAFKPTIYPGRTPYKVFSGANTMLAAGGHKICAEQVALSAARAEGYPRVVGIAIAGLPQADSRSGLLTDTLHPCCDCRDVLRTFPEVAGETVVTTAHLTEEIFERFTVKELLELHDCN